MTLPFKRIMVIINPAAGHDEPILNTLNDVFHSAGVDWDIRITHKSGDATRLAKEAVELGFELVAGYGGDGRRWKLPMACWAAVCPRLFCRAVRATPWRTT